MKKVFTLFYIVVLFFLFPTIITLASGIPANIKTAIKAKVSSEYPGDYSTQKYWINEEVEAYKKLQNYQNPEIPFNIIEEIKRKVATEYPGSYTTQWYWLNEEIQAYKDINK